MKNIKALIAKVFSKIFSDGYLSRYHKVSLLLAVCSYVAILFYLHSEVVLHSPETVKYWYEKIPSVSTIVESKPLRTLTQLHEEKAVDNSNYHPYAKKISIIISDMGMSRSVTEKAINELPKEFTLTFSPYSPYLNELIAQSVEKEHENLILMPMESINYPTEDSGHKVLSSRLSATENKENMEWVFEKGGQAIGIMNFFGSSFLKDKKHTKVLFDEMRDRDILFVENFVGENSKAQEMAAENGIKYLRTDKKIISDTSEENFMKQLKDLENTAKIKGYAIGIIEPYPLAIDLVKNWSLKLNSKGFMLASLSTLWKNIHHHD